MKRPCLALVLALVAGLPNARAEPLRLTFVGDVMLADGPGRVIAAGGDPLEPFAPILAEPDYVIGNLECALAAAGTPRPNKIFSFRAEPGAVALLKGRFHALGVANNHSGDYGQAAFLETLQRLREAGIAPFGGGRNLAEAHAPLWIEAKGLRVAVLAYNEFKPRAFEAGPDWPGVAWSEDSQVVADIRAARGAGADLVIPFMHWGWEHEPEPGERQRQLARLMIDAGADAVVGGHPHVTQGAEHYQGKPIVYSLGNFIFDGFESPEARLGWVLHLRLEKSGVVAWETRAARIDADGVPHPAPGMATPCGWAGEDSVRECLNPEPAVAPAPVAAGADQ